MTTSEHGPADAGPSTTSLRAALRAGCTDRHARLDAAFEGMERAETPTLYHAFVRMNEACHRQIEPILARSDLAARIADWHARARAAVLHTDLAAMRLAPLSLAPFPLPAPDLAEAFGIAYVLEGSRLGGRFIRRAMLGAGRPEAWPGLSMAYLDTMEEADRFRGFMLRAEELLPDAPARDRAVRAANVTFDHFIAACGADASSCERAA